jgi:hypothetical protein
MRKREPLSDGERWKEEEEERCLEQMWELSKLSKSCICSPPPPDSNGWGVPDWRDQASYPTLDEMDQVGWRWEFLRRRHGYRLDWCRDPGEFGVSQARYFQDVYGIAPPADPLQSVRQLLKKAESFRPSKEALFPSGWGHDFRFVEERLSGRYASFDELSRIIPPEPHWYDVYIRMDLRQELQPQFAVLLKLFKRIRRPRAVRQHPHRWSLYLRLLDARDAGASYADCAAILPRHLRRTPQRARDMVRAAERLRRQWPFSIDRAN